MKKLLATAALVVSMAVVSWAVQGQDAAPARGPDMGEMLLGGLRQTEGCLKAEAVQFRDGRLAIMAWFKDKPAVERWYSSAAHQRMMQMTGVALDGRKPLEHITDPETPVLVIASMVMDPANKRVPGPIPLREISIELYTPAPGGAMIGGRLAPEGFNMPHMRVFPVGGGDQR